MEGWKAARGWYVVACVRRWELFKEATCVRETRELVRRLATDKSVARAFFNRVSLTPALVRPACLGWRHLPRGPIISSSFSSLSLLFVHPESARFYRSIARLTPKDARPYRRPRNQAGFTDSRSGRELPVVGSERGGRWRVNRRDRILFSIGAAIFMPRTPGNGPRYRDIFAREWPKACGEFAGDAASYRVSFDFHPYRSVIATTALRDNDFRRFILPPWISPRFLFVSIHWPLQAWKTIAGWKLFFFYLSRRSVEELSSSLDSRVAVHVQLPKVLDDSSRNIVVSKVLNRFR